MRADSHHAGPGSPGSSALSSIGSPQGTDYEGSDFEAQADRPPSKRQRTGAASSTLSHIADPEAAAENDEPMLDGLSDISSDTSGDIPNSPAGARLEEEDFIEQVTACHWDGCSAGDLGTMDKLVDHIHNSHIENRQKKYTCEWMSCTRKGLPHASGYALKAHMRSHTREKPFHCYLPECDRAFTRSDALAKHMRTVHETEALRPSDPVPKSMQPVGKSKVKIIIKTPLSQAHNDDDPDESATPEEHAEFFTPLADLFDKEELAQNPVDKLYRRCHWELKWAEDIGKALAKECREWEEMYHKEWLEKEVLLSQVIQSEVDWHERRQAILSGTADIQIEGPRETGKMEMETEQGEQEEKGEKEEKEEEIAAVDGDDDMKEASPVAA